MSPGEKDTALLFTALGLLLLLLHRDRSTPLSYFSPLALLLFIFLYSFLQWDFGLVGGHFPKRETHTACYPACIHKLTVAYPHTHTHTQSLSSLSHILFVSQGNDPFVNALIILRKWIGCCSLLMARCASVFIACVHGRCQIFRLGVSIVNCSQVFATMWGASHVFLFAPGRCRNFEVKFNNF